MSTPPPPADRFDHSPIGDLLGLEVETAETGGGEAVVRMPGDSRLANPMGRVHGGAIAALADAAMGIAFGRSLLPEQDFATIDLQIQFIRPVVTGLLVARARLIQRGLRIGYAECEITGPRGKLIAKATCTCTILSE